MSDMHPLLQTANDGIREMLEGAGNVKGVAFLNIASTMLLLHQQVWMAEVLHSLVPDDDTNADEIVALVRSQANQAIEILSRFLAAPEAAEVQQLAHQLISRQRLAAQRYEAGQQG